MHKQRACHISNYNNCLWVKNAFPVSGQLYTTHLLSLEALLTVIDSIEAHCQAKVVNGAASQEPGESLSGEAAAKDGTDGSGINPRSGSGFG